MKKIKIKGYVTRGMRISIAVSKNANAWREIFTAMIGLSCIFTKKSDVRHSFYSKQVKDFLKSFITKIALIEVALRILNGGHK